MSQMTSLRNAEKACANDIAPDASAPVAHTHAHAPVGRGSRTRPAIVVVNTASRDQASGVRPAGIGSRKRTASPSASDAARGAGRAPFHPTGAGADAASASGAARGGAGGRGGAGVERAGRARLRGARNEGGASARGRRREAPVHPFLPRGRRPGRRRCSGSRPPPPMAATNHAPRERRPPAWPPRRRERPRRRAARGDANAGQHGKKRGDHRGAGEEWERREGGNAARERPRAPPPALPFSPGNA